MVSADLFVVSLIPVLKLLLVSTVGSFLALDRVNILTEDASNHLNNIVFYVFAPCLIAVNLAETITVETIISLWFMPVNIIFTYIIGSVFGWIVIRITGAPSKLRGLIVGCCSAGNLGNLPIIIIPAICKEKASPFGDPETCYTFGMAYATLSMAAGGVCTWLYVYNVMQMYLSKENSGVEAYVSINETNGFGLLSKPHLGSCKEPLLESVSINRNFTNELAVHHGSSHVPIFFKFKQTLKMLEEKVNFKRLFAPSTIAVIIGFGVGLLPQIRNLVIGDTAPLRVIGDSTALLGAGTVPVLTLILGGNLVNCSKEPEIKMPVMIGIIVARYVLMPLSGVLIIKSAIHFGIINSDPLYVFVLLLQFTLPPAMNIGIICQLFGQGVAECSLIMLWTYSIAPVLLTLWSTYFVWVLS